jgi:hypothetical protein
MIRIPEKKKSKRDKRYISIYNPLNLKEQNRITK